MDFVGIPELLIVLVIVVLIFGPGRLVRLGKELGSGIREFRQGLEDNEQDDEEEAEETKPNDE